MSTERACGPCSMCCRLLKVDPLQKPAGTWCEHCRPGEGGCSIHADAQRPAVCGDFACLWLRGLFSDHWRPDLIRVVIAAGSGRDILIHAPADRSERCHVPGIAQYLANRVAGHGGRVFIVRGERRTLYTYQTGD